jgi:STAS-like domain of unknown function (DUF4325)
VLELAKGKFTTDPSILSGGVYFSHEFDKKEDWILQANASEGGTLVRMVLHNHTARTTKKIFDTFSSGDDYGFNKTVVPVKLMTYGDENLVSRSQAKRLLVRFERFKTVTLDFSGVTSVGQAFADEVFRVFTSKHPGVELIPVHANADVKRMIARAQALAASGRH